jgi:hypothetical protein
MRELPKLLPPLRLWETKGIFSSRRHCAVLIYYLTKCVILATPHRVQHLSTKENRKHEAPNIIIVPTMVSRLTTKTVNAIRLQRSRTEILHGSSMTNSSHLNFSRPLIALAVLCFRFRPMDHHRKTACRHDNSYRPPLSSVRPRCTTDRPRSEKPRFLAFYLLIITMNEP